MVPSHKIQLHKRPTGTTLVDIHIHKADSDSDSDSTGSRNGNKDRNWKLAEIVAVIVIAIVTG